MELLVGTKVKYKRSPRVIGTIASGKDHDGDYKVNWQNPQDASVLILTYVNENNLIVVEGPEARLAPPAPPAAMPEKTIRRHQASQTSSPRGQCGKEITLKEEPNPFADDDTEANDSPPTVTDITPVPIGYSGSVLATGDTVTTVTEAEASSLYIKTEGIPKMSGTSGAASSNQTRRTVTLNLIDPDTSLDVSKSLVGTYGPVVVEDDIQTVINEICMEQDVANAIANHNKKREKETDLTILKNTGNKVGLQPVKLKDLKWEIK